MRNQNPYQPKNLMLKIVLIIGIMLAMGVSVVNMFSVLMSSMLPVFLESEFKAWMVSLIPVGASLVIKFVPQGFEFEESKVFYRQVLYALTSVSILGWIILVAHTFQGMGGDMSIENMLDGGDSGGVLYVAVQLLTEVLISACLATALQKIQDDEAPAKPDSRAKQVYEHLCAKQAELAEARLHLLNATRALETFHTERKTFAGKQAEAYTLLKAQYHFIKHPGDRK